MVWSFIRVAIFSAAFVVGMVIAGPGSQASADSSSDSQIAQFDNGASPRSSIFVIGGLAGSTQTKAVSSCTRLRIRGRFLLTRPRGLFGEEGMMT